MWSETSVVYRCGALTTPERLAGPLSPLLARLARRWIAAGIGRDSTVEVE